MKILVTGAAGFIGYHLVKALSQCKHLIIGLDNINHYYQPSLKWARLRQLGISQPGSAQHPPPAPPSGTAQSTAQSTAHPNLRFIQCHLEDQSTIDTLFQTEKFNIVINLAAQAGVRHSLRKPMDYTQSNLVGFTNILEACRQHRVEHLIYASSSSVYGLNTKLPFSEHDPVDQPSNIYAATKRANELMAYSYSHLFGLRTTGLRFFTVYGPWGRPDMALFLFTRAALARQPIQLFNYGNMSRDFTYIDDIIRGIISMIDTPSEITKNQKLPAINTENYQIYNLGHGQSVPLARYISALEQHLGLKIEKKHLPMQRGEIPATHADITRMARHYNYKPTISVEEGVGHFVKWYLDFFD